MIIARNDFRTTPDRKGLALKSLEIILWEYVEETKDSEGYIISEGLKVRYEDTRVSIFYFSNISY